MIQTSYRAWESSSSRAVFLLVHGLGANTSWWEPFADFFLKNNFSSYAVDLKNDDSFNTFSQDISNVRDIIKKRYPGKKVFAIGESMGSLLIISMALKNSSLFDGVICMSPVFKSRAPLKSSDYIKIFLPLLYDPKKRYKLPLRPDMCTRDANYIKIIEADYSKDILSTSKVLFDIFLAQIHMLISDISLAAPILFLLAGEDKVVDNNVNRKIYAKINAADKNIVEYPGMYHSLSIDTGKENVFQDILKWVGERI